MMISKLSTASLTEIFKKINNCFPNKRGFV